ncbi:MAG: hypothetical protein K9G49_13920 [Taibaiella sp.]|nr:hypothetical protein [Taibaiella sp.]
MKKLLLILGLGIFANIAVAQDLDALHAVQDGKKNVIAYIHHSIIENQDKKTIGLFQPDGRITDLQANTLGFLINDSEIQDKNRKTVAYIKLDGTIENNQHVKIGSIRQATGPVFDQSSNVIGFINNVEPTWAAAYFFLLKPSN